ALTLSREAAFFQEPLAAFATWARAFTANWHRDIALFVAITFPIAFLTTTARKARKHLAWTDVVLAAASFAVGLYYIVLDDKFLNWSRGFSQPTLWDTAVGFALLGLVIAGASGNAWVYAAGAMFAGLGGGAFYAIFANLVLEFFGETTVLQNQATVYSAKAIGGLLGVGGGAVLVTTSGYAPVFTAAGLLGLATSVMVRFLKQPGYPVLPLRPQLGTPVVDSAQPSEPSPPLGSPRPSG
ncbi:MAG: hypothetical protein ACRDOY_10670, partial [Nocardioidaceae bacterium]